MLTLQQFVTGDIPLFVSNFTLANGTSIRKTYANINVLKVNWMPRYPYVGFNSTRDKGIMWPPKGWIPYLLVPDYWSIMLPDYNFTYAYATVFKDENPRDLGVTTRHDSFVGGDAQLIWTKPNVTDIIGDYTVVLQNVSKVGVAGPYTYIYMVHVFDPYVPFTTRTSITTRATGTP